MMKKTIGFTLGVVLIAGWLVTGLYSVSSQETGITFFWGSVVNRSVPPGLHYHIPWPLGRIDRVETTTMKSMPIGFRLIDHATGVKPTPEQCEWLTGDTNVLRIQLLIQYVVSDPFLYLYAGYNPEEILRSAGEASLTRRLGHISVDDALTTGWALLSEHIQEDLQDHLDRCQTGFTIVNIQRIAIEPPEEVREAFQEVTDARQDRSRLITQARVEMEEVLPQARGKAETILAKADSQRSLRIAQAKGDAEKFLALLPEIQNASESIKIRLYRETMEKILPRLKKHVLVRSPGGSTVPIHVFLQKRKFYPASGNETNEKFPTSGAFPLPEQSDMIQFLQERMDEQNKLD